jgi:hypothetical protein
VAGQSVQERGEEGPVGGGEPDLVAVQLSFEHRDLVAEKQDLGVLGAVAHRQQPQQREGVGHAEVGQSEEHDDTSSRRDRRRSAATSRHRPTCTPRPGSNGHDQDG